MTQNQVEYWKLQELKRANLITEQQAREMAAETRRHNLAVEQNEASRIEVSRQSNYLTSLANAETARSNRAKEQLSTTDQLLRQYLGQLQAEVTRYSSDVNRENALTNAATQRYVAQTNYASALYSANTSAAASRYSSDNSLKGTQISATSRETIAASDRNAATIQNSINNARAARQLAETIRHNKEMEKTESFKANTSLVGTLVKGMTNLKPNGLSFLQTIR